MLRGLVRSGEGTAARTAIELLPLGVSQRGVPIEALAVTRTPAPVVIGPATPTRRPAVLIVAGQHGDEPAAPRR